MTTPKDLGDYLEEIVADYLHFVERYSLVSRQQTFLDWNWIRDPSRPGKKRRVRSPYDLDIVAIKGGNMLLVSCKTNSLSTLEMRRELDKLKRGQKILGLKRYRTQFAMAFATGSRSDLTTRAPCRVLFLDQIIKKFIGSIPSTESKLTHGRYLWLLTKMHRFGLVNESID